METILDRLDNFEAIRDPMILQSRDIGDTSSETRKDLFKNIEIKFKEYGKSLIQRSIT